MKKIYSVKKRFIVFVLLLITVMLFSGIQSIKIYPEEIRIYEGERVLVGSSSPYTLSIPATFGGALSESGIVEDNKLSDNNKYVKISESGNYYASVKLFGAIPIRDVDINVQDTKKVIPGGEVIGIKMFTKGLLCVDVSEIAEKNGTILNPSVVNDIKIGDILLSANGKELKTTEMFADIVENSLGKDLDILLERDNKIISKVVKPILTPEGYKLGLWLRDSTAGIGTLSFVDNSNGMYGALGHPICDSDTGVILPVSDGEIIEASIFDIEKGKDGSPGELKGTFDSDLKGIGTIEKNINCGIYGVVNQDYQNSISQEINIASKNSVLKGNAQIISDVDGNGKKKYNIEIQKIFLNSTDVNKNMIIKIVDDKLLEKTGGIVQGMSGSPILQNGKLVGAVTHVFVNDPTRGYGIFIENMLAEAEKIK